MLLLAFMNRFWLVPSMTRACADDRIERGAH
ncbi:MAG: hypothetical protein ABIL01_12220 [Pseudomonadota bacterium]